MKQQYRNIYILHYPLTKVSEWTEKPVNRHVKNLRAYPIKGFQHRDLSATG